VSAAPCRAPASLAAALSALRRRGAVGIAVERSQYSTSHATFDVTVTDADGRVRQLVWKALGDTALLPDAQLHRPEFARSGARETLVYRSLLAGRSLGTPTCEAAGTASAPWILLERVDGRELYQIGEWGSWERAAAWLARHHTGPLPPARLGARLAHYERAWFERFPARAQRAATTASARRRLEAVLAHWQLALDALDRMPAVFVHGDFYASNVLIERGTGRVRPVDWEMAGLGPPLLDLAALTSGTVGADGRERLGAAYLAALPRADRPSAGRLADDLRWCRVLLAVQWLGWSPGWVPPREHRTDWLAAAEAALAAP